MTSRDRYQLSRKTPKKPTRNDIASQQAATAPTKTRCQRGDNQPRRRSTRSAAPSAATTARHDVAGMIKRNSLCGIAEWTAIMAIAAATHIIEARKRMTINASRTANATGDIENRSDTYHVAGLTPNSEAFSSTTLMKTART